MADPFDLYLRRALAPDAREPDPLFVGRVRTRVALDERLRAERGAMLRRLGMQLLALAVVTAAVLGPAQHPDFAEVFARSPAAALAGLIGGFALVVVALASPGGGWRHAR